MAKTRVRTSFRPKLISLAVASCFASGPVLANPTGANVVHGTAAIHRAGNLLQITNSPNAIINWQSFSIGASEVTRFIQQSASSAVLNRVVTQDPSTILGALQSNGRVFLINPNGILFGAGAQVDVAGLVASTLNLSNEDFLAGRMRFTDGLGKSVVNDGGISTPSGGSVYLIGSAVTNNGIITSPSGEVVLAAGNSVELVEPGTPNLRVEVAASDHEARNLGQIISDAGRIGIYAGLINNSGTIRADSAVSEGGRILLKATKNVTLEAESVTTANGTTGGSVTVQSADTTLVSGSVQATGTDGAGGSVQILGNLVGLIGDAAIDVSGDTGGGTVLVGGDFQGKNPDIQNAFRTYVGPDATISADAITSGDGGKVIVWSDDATRAYGTISVRGGMQSGDGGFAEVSGKRYLDYQARTIATAPNGKTGTLLLDPTNITIDNGDPLLDTGGFDGDPFFLSGTLPARISWATIKANLAQTGVNAIISTSSLEQEPGNIIIAADSPDLASSNTLDLRANNDILVNGSITNTGIGNVVMYAGYNDDVLTPGVNSGVGTINLDAPIMLGTPGLRGNVLLVAGNGITQALTAPITAGGLLADGGAGNVNMQAANLVGTLQGSIHALTPADGSAFSFRFKNAQTLDIGSFSQRSSGGVNVQIDPLVAASYGVDIDISTTSGDLNVNQPISAVLGLILQVPGEIIIIGPGPTGGSGPNLTARVNLAAAQDVNVANGIRGSRVALSAARDVNVTDLNLLQASISAIGEGHPALGVSSIATVALNAGRNVNVSNSSILAVAYDETTLFPGTASISLTAGATGTVNISSASDVTAQLGGGGRLGAGFGGGSSTVNLDAGSGVTVSDSVVHAGGSSSGSFVTIGGGRATVNVNGNNGPVNISNSTLEAVGGFAEAAGFAATVNVSGNGITVGSTIRARALFGSGGGGDATVSLNGNGGTIQIQSGTTLSAIGGSASNVGGGQGLVSLSANSISVQSGATVSATGGSAFAPGVAGGTGTVRFSAGGGISVTGGIVSANGGDGSSGGTGGNASIVMNAGGSLGVNGNVSANGGAGGSLNSSGANGGAGGRASVSMSGSSISISGCCVSANGGDGASGNSALEGTGGNGGAGGGASMSLSANSISLNGGNIFAGGGRGGNGGFGPSGDGNGGTGGGARVTMSANSMNVNGGFVSASGGSGGFGSGSLEIGGTASVLLTSTGNIVAQQFSFISADGAEGGTAAVNLIAAGDIMVNSSGVQAFGGFGNGGDVGVGLAAGGNITVDGGEGLFASGGGGSAIGGAAAITVAAGGSITVDQASISAQGGSGSVTGGAAAVTLSANGGTISVLDTPFSILARGGFSNVNGGSAAISMFALNGMTIDNSRVEASGYPGLCAQCATQNGGAGLVSLNAGQGTINLMNGSDVGAVGGTGTVTNGLGRIDLTFSGRVMGGYFLDGVEGLIVDDLLQPLSGFFVNGLPAVLDTNMFVTYLSSVTFNDILVATMNQQVDVLADQLKAGETGEDEEEEKKLPFCS